ncbi:MAG: hypothetical protein P8J20_00420 [Novosphingobium sp.]|nr:hypothetical protein [Novosphingobium sp.]
MMPLKVLAFAAISDRIGMVVLHGEKLKDWQTTEKVAKSSVDAAAYAQEIINSYRPHVVVTERLGIDNRKGAATQKLIAAMEMVAEHNSVIHVATEHHHSFPSKYEEAAALVAIYPALQPWLPKKRRIFDHQPRSMVLFEALSLANCVAHGGAGPLAAAM